MAVSEKIELLGKGLYKDIPSVLTLKSLPTASELDYVGGEDFQATLLNKIFPKVVEEKIDFKQLLEIDFHWICRCLRILTYGPYYTVNNIFCPDCQVVSGEYQVDLRAVDVKQFPEGFSGTAVIKADEFIDFNGDIELKLPTIQDTMNAAKDSMFIDENGDLDREFARICYSIKSIKGNSKLSIPEIKFEIQTKLSAADYYILKTLGTERTDFGLRAGGRTVCPQCHNKEAGFVALVDDRFFRPTMGDLRAWKADRLAKAADQPANGVGESRGRVENIPGAAPRVI